MADEAYPQDDLTARLALLSYLEGEVPLDDAAKAYVACFPPIAAMDVDHVKHSWSTFSAARKVDMARHIRLGMAGLQEPDEDDD